MILADYVLLTAVGLWAVWAVVAVVRRRLRGESFCGGNCSACGHCSECRKK